MSTTRSILFTAIASFIFLALAAGDSVKDQADKPAKPSTPAQLAFERMKSLAGKWEGADQEKRAERVQYELIAGGSCVVESFEFVNQPENKMVTVYHMDGDSLMLTHYCMAGNQPRMKATQINSDASEITFTFMDGTGMASRDIGHMDKAVFKFADANHYSSRWTWYQDGKESWMEESSYTRKK